jgi:hypothetical protein
LSKLVQGRFFEVEPYSLNIHVVGPTKAQFKYMMGCKGKERMEKSGSLTKITLKQASIEGGKVQNLLQWI